jgi:hypothetical protein
MAGVARLPIAYATMVKLSPRLEVRVCLTSVTAVPGFLLAGSSVWPGRCIAACTESQVAESDYGARRRIGGAPYVLRRLGAAPAKNTASSLATLTTVPTSSRWR